MTETDQDARHSKEVQQPNFEAMSTDDWYQYLRHHPDLCLVMNCPDGVHTVEYDGERVTWYKGGSLGYDRGTTYKIIKDIADSDGSGLTVQTKAETYS